MGYQKLTIKPGLQLLGNAFYEVGTNQKVPLNGMFQDDAQKAKATDDAMTADYLQVYLNGADYKGYDNYFFGAGDWGEGYDYKWYWQDDDAEPTEFVIEPGQGFWYRNRGTESIQLVVAGEVTTNDVTVTIKQGLNLISNPFPVDLPLNGGPIDWLAAGATATDDAMTADYIQVYVNTESYKGYDNYFFGAGDWGDDYDYKWYWQDDDSEPTDFVIKAGEGFWYRNRGTSDFQITFKSPVK